MDALKWVGGLFVWLAVWLAMGAALAFLIVASVSAAPPDPRKACREFADEVVRQADIRAKQPDEDQAHTMVPLMGPMEQWPTLHWIIRLIYRVPADKLHAEAVRECIAYDSKSA